jgi:hypothetical protein
MSMLRLLFDGHIAQGKRRKWNFMIEWQSFRWELVSFPMLPDPAHIALHVSSVGPTIILFHNFHRGMEQ